MKVIFENDLETSRYKSFKGYKHTFTEFITSMKEADSTTPPLGTVNIDPDMDAATQFLVEVKVSVGMSTSLWNHL